MRGSMVDGRQQSDCDAYDKKPKPGWLTADTAYGTGKLLAWLLGKGITPHIPVWERYPSSDGMFSRGEFTCDAERDVYVCPNGSMIAASGTTCHNLKSAALARSSNDVRAHR